VLQSALIQSLNQVLNHFEFPRFTCKMKTVETEIAEIAPLTARPSDPAFEVANVHASLEPITLIWSEEQLEGASITSAAGNVKKRLMVGRSFPHIFKHQIRPPLYHETNYIHFFLSLIAFKGKVEQPLQVFL